MATPQPDVGRPRDGGIAGAESWAGKDLNFESTVPEPAADGADPPPFQVMPALSGVECDALRADVADRGIVVPVVVDQHGRVLDGHHRRRVAVELGIECPSEVREVADDDDARSVALALNVARRHLSREQVRDLIAVEFQRRPADSDRTIARRFGCSPSTVGAVRARVSKLDSRTEHGDARPPITREQAEASTAAVREHLGALDAEIAAAAGDPIHTALLVTGITAGMQQMEQEHAGDEELLAPVRAVIFQPRLDALLTVGGVR